MFAVLQYNELKPRAICVADGALINGTPVAYSVSANGRKLTKATAHTKDIVTNAMNFDGINAILEQTDAEHEAIADGALCIRVPLEKGDIIATTELTTTGLSVGDALTVSAGKYVKDSGNTPAGDLVYGGVYDNPWGLDMYIVEVVE